MSLSNGLSKGPAATSNERPGTDGEASAYAPKWAREASDTAHAVSHAASHGAPPGAPHGGIRKVVPLRMPALPQVGPAPAPAPVQSAGRRPTGPELLAEDEVLKRLLQRHAPDPQPLVAKPTRDPVGFALGMIARLIVAGCAAAVAAMLLLGVIPLPFRLSVPVASETAAPAVTAAPATMMLASAAPTARATPVATIAVRAVDAAPATVGAAAAQVAPAAVAHAAPAPADRWGLDAGEVARLVKRGEDYLAQGDIAAARLILGRVAGAAHDARAALSLGATYDPVVLRNLHVIGFTPDVAQARVWYEKAAGYGSHDAAARLAALPSANP
jgi:hypothetical protein